MDPKSTPPLTVAQQCLIGVFGAIVGLALAALLHAGTVASIALVALVGILIGIGIAARQARR
jgi:hypothetical protein